MFCQIQLNIKVRFVVTLHDTSKNMTDSGTSELYLLGSLDHFQELSTAYKSASKPGIFTCYGIHHHNESQFFAACH